MRSRWPALALFALALAPPLWAGDPSAADKKSVAVPTKGKVYHVPYRLTDTQHILVRAKINGKGPFNFIVDTGAPLLYVAEPVAKKIGLPIPKKKSAEKKDAEKQDAEKRDAEKQDANPKKVADKKDADKKGRGGAVTLDRFEIEGGVAQSKIKCIVETPFQLTGMNAFGMAGEELHGMIGYTVLAHYKLEIDFTRDKMVWTQLNYEPKQPVPLGLKGQDPGQKQLEELGGFMKALAFLMGKKPGPPPLPRGFLGVELAEKDGAVTVTKVLKKTPADQAGLLKGDRISEVQGEAVRTSADVLRRAARVTAGQTVRLTILRGEDKKEITVTAGEGL
jgi:hypothetical protein